MKVLSRAPIIKKDPITGFEDRYEIKFLGAVYGTNGKYLFKLRKNDDELTIMVNSLSTGISEITDNIDSYWNLAWNTYNNKTCYNVYVNFDDDDKPHVHVETEDYESFKLHTTPDVVNTKFTKENWPSSLQRLDNDNPLYKIMVWLGPDEKLDIDKLKEIVNDYEKSLNEN